MRSDNTNNEKTSTEESRKAIKLLKGVKATSSDGFPVETIQVNTNSLIK